ncbi:D-lactate dehydrogenase (cytochrome) [Aspergillus flavus]|nr:D-lactate dehydrogenase (cytochrome) [Aspergillus flavus]
MRPIPRAVSLPRFRLGGRATIPARTPFARYNHVEATRQARSDSNGRSSVQWGLTGLVTGIGGCLLVSRWQSSDSSQVDSSEVGGAKGVEYADKEAMIKGIKIIEETLGEDSVSWDEEEIAIHGYSELSTSNCEARPIAVVRPKTTEDVAFIAKICTAFKIPMIPFAGGSSVEGNFVAPYSGLTIDFSDMKRIVSFHPDDMDVVVQPGVNWVDLNKLLKNSGLFLPLDPSPTALIGGMVATNCSGTNAVRYGTMKDWVVNVTVVLADGNVIKTRHRPRKTSAGYNLTSLFTGSEGTLGMITEITLKLATIPEKQSVAVATFPSIREAAATASKIMRTGIQIAALEMMDETQMMVINKNGGAGGRLWEEKPTLLFKFSGTQRAIEEDVERVRTISSQHSGENFEFAKSEEEMNSLWAARKESLWAMLAARPEGTQIWSTDVAVPLSRMAEIIDLSKKESGQLGLFSSVLGHVGDGNFHQAVMYNPNDPEQKQSVRDCVLAMVHRAVEMEGTVSGEHGIGLGKKECLLEELGPETVGVMRTLKRSLDPHCLLNPGKIFD